MVQPQSTAEGPNVDHPGARRWSPRWGRIGALLTLLIPLAMMLTGWAMRSMPNLPLPQTRPGRLPAAYWDTKAALTTPRVNLALAAADGRLWAIGGSGEGGAPLSTVEVYDPIARIWTAGPALPAALSSAAVTTIDSTIYLFGGQSSGQGALDSANALDPRTGQWRTLAPLPTASFGAAATVLDGTIYLVGGQGPSGPNTATYAYTPDSNSWRAIAPLPTARAGLSAVNFNGKLYALGGLVNGQASTLVEIFDPATGVWSAGPAMLGPMANFGAIVYNGRLHAIEGEVQQVFDPRADKWVTTSPLPTPRSGQGIAALGDTIFAVGGRGSGTTEPLALSEGYQPGEYEEPDTFRLFGFDRGGATAVVVGFVVTLTLMATSLRSGRPRPQPELAEEEAGPPTQQ